MGTLWIVLQSGSVADRTLVSIDGVAVLDIPARPASDTAVSRSFEVPSGDHFVQVEFPRLGWKGNARFSLADKATVLVRRGDLPSIEIAEGRLVHGN